MIMGTPVASAAAGAFAVNPSALLIPFKMVTTKDTLNTGTAVATATYTTRAATQATFTSVATDKVLSGVGDTPIDLVFVFTPSTASSYGSLRAGKAWHTGIQGGVGGTVETSTSGANSAIFTIINSGSGTYTVAVTNAGTNYDSATNDKIVVPGSLLGGASPANDATITVIGAAGAAALSAANVVITGTAASDTIGNNGMSDTITITSDKDVFVYGKTPVCTSTVGSVTALTISTKIVVLTVAGDIGVSQTTVTCKEGDGAINLNPLAGTVTYSMVTTMDTQKSSSKSYITYTQGTLATSATQVAVVGTDGTTPSNVILTWTPDTTTTTAPTWITFTSTGSSLWAATPATLSGCTLTQTGSTLVLVKAATTTVTTAADTMTITFTGAAAAKPQTAIVLTCSEASELAANPLAITTFTTTGVSSTDAAPSVAATHRSVSAMVAIDGDIDVTTAALTPSKITLKATTTTAIPSSKASYAGIQGGVGGTDETSTAGANSAIFTITNTGFGAYTVAVTNAGTNYDSATAGGETDRRPRHSARRRRLRNERCHSHCRRGCRIKISFFL